MTSCTRWKKNEVWAGRDQLVSALLPSCRPRLLDGRGGPLPAGRCAVDLAGELRSRGIAAWSQESQPFCARASGKVISDVLALNKIGVGNLEMERLYEFINFSLQIGPRRSFVSLSRRRHPCSGEQLGRPASGLGLSLMELGLPLTSCSFAFFPYKPGPVWAVVKVRERGGRVQSPGPTPRQPHARGSSNVRRWAASQPGREVAGLEARRGSPKGP